MQIFRVSAQKSIKIRQRFWESFEVGPDLKHDQINDSSFNKRALKNAKMVLRLSISKFS
jgi:hypothetical protein